MNILHIVSSLDPKGGGVSQAIRTIAKCLATKFIQNEVVTVDHPNSPFLEVLASKVYALGPAKSNWQYSRKLHIWLVENISRFDTIVIHGLWQYPGIATFRAWRRLGESKPKLFVMPHGMLDPYFQNAKGRRLKAVRNRIVWTLVEKEMINNVTGLLFTCLTEKMLAKQPFHSYRPLSEEIVGLGVEPPPQFDQVMEDAFLEKSGMDSGPYILFISRIHEKKGLHALIEGYLATQKTIPTLPKLVVAGPGLESDFGVQMRTLAAGNQSIIFTGMLTGNSKWGALYGCEAFILPSHQENFGIAVVESLACCRAVLISNQVNIHQEISDAKAGLVAVDSAAGVSQLLRQWSALLPAEKSEMNLRAKALYERSFSDSKFTEVIFSTLVDNPSH